MAASRIVGHKDRNIGLSMHAVLEGSMAIARYDRRQCRVTGFEEKPEDLGHHSIVTPVDYVSQKAILNYIALKRPNIPIITEEKEDSNPHGLLILKADEPELIKKALGKTEGVAVIDPLCGSSPHAAGQVTSKGFIGGSYSVTVGITRFGESGLHVIAGAVRDADYKGGTLYYGSAEAGTTAIINGTYVKVGNFIVSFGGREINAVVDSRVANLKESVVIFNADMPLADRYPVLHNALGTIAPAARTSLMLESCGGSMARVSSGWAHGMVHAPISPEHWIAGAALIEGAGGKVIFYELDDAGRPVRLEKLEVRHMLPGVRSAGFVAGNEPIAEELMNMLVNAGRKI